MMRRSIAPPKRCSTVPSLAGPIWTILIISPPSSLPGFEHQIVLPDDAEAAQVLVGKVQIRARPPFACRPQDLADASCPGQVCRLVTGEPSRGRELREGYFSERADVRAIIVKVQQVVRSRHNHACVPARLQNAVELAYCTDRIRQVLEQPAAEDALEVVLSERKGVGIAEPDAQTLRGVETHDLL